MKRISELFDHSEIVVKTEIVSAGWNKDLKITFLPLFHFIHFKIHILSTILI